MAFDDFEVSTDEGESIALYEFRWGSVYWRYTSADRAITYPEGSENVYQAVSIMDNGMTQGGSDQNDFTITLQSNLPIVNLFKGTPPSSTIWVTVRRRHRDDPDDEAAVWWIGRVANVKRLENQAEAEARCISLLSMFKRGGLRLTWGRNCPHVVYDSQCRVAAALHEYERTILEVTTTTVKITVATTPVEGTFTGGYVEWDRGGGGTLERRGIEEMISDTEVRIFGKTDGLAPGDTIWLYPGCNRTAEVCQNGFGNIANNGGFRFMPGDSPFTGATVF